MRVIVLGMDNTGKTTLCNYLRDVQDFELVHSCGPNKTKEEMESFIRENLKRDNVVFERFCFFEELVYGKILRNESKFSFKDDIFQYILESGVSIIYCRPSLETIKNWQNREQMDGVIDNVEELTKRFDKVIRKASKAGINVIKYNYKKDKMFDVIGNL